MDHLYIHVLNHVSSTWRQQRNISQVTTTPKMKGIPSSKLLAMATRSRGFFVWGRFGGSFFVKALVFPTFFWSLVLQVPFEKVSRFPKLPTQRKTTEGFGARGGIKQLKYIFVKQKNVWIHIFIYTYIYVYLFIHISIYIYDRIYVYTYLNK